MIDVWFDVFSVSRLGKQIDDHFPFAVKLPDFCFIRVPIAGNSSPNFCIEIKVSIILFMMDSLQPFNLECNYRVLDSNSTYSWNWYLFLNIFFSSRNGVTFQIRHISQKM